MYECTKELSAMPEKKDTNLLINKEYNSDDELASDVEESTSVNSDEHQLDKNDAALDDDKGSEDESYEEYDMFMMEIMRDFHL